MLTYLEDTNTYESWNGSAWVDLIDPDTVINPMTSVGDMILGGASGTPERLALGSAGNVITSNGTTALWQAPAGAAGLEWTLLNSGGTSLTGATTITVSSLGGYDNYIVQIEGASSANALSIISIRVNGSSTNYSIQNLVSQASSSYSANNIWNSSTQTTEVSLGRMETSVGATGRVNAFAQISGASTSGSKSIQGFGSGDVTGGGGGQQARFSGGFWNDSATITSISVISSTGNFDAGTIYVYGA
jgi:hypothetical protein